MRSTIMFKRGRGQTAIEVRSESTMAMDLKRQVKVKTGVVKRLRKELAMYEQEKVQNDKRVEDMRASGADVYDVRQAVGVVTPTPPPTSPLLSSRLPVQPLFLPSR